MRQSGEKEKERKRRRVYGREMCRGNMHSIYEHRGDRLGTERKDRDRGTEGQRDCGHKVISEDLGTWHWDWPGDHTQGEHLPSRVCV